MLMKAQTSLRLSGRASAAPLSLSAKERQLIESLIAYGHDVRFFSGNAVRDLEHQGLFNDVNGLRAAILCGRPVDEVDGMIDILIRDMARHFRIEEAILATAGYPGTGKHAVLHRNLADHAATRVRGFRAGTLGIGEVFRFLAHDVIVKHALDADRECYPWLRPH